MNSKKMGFALVIAFLSYTQNNAMSSVAHRTAGKISTMAGRLPLYRLSTQPRSITSTTAPSTNSYSNLKSPSQLFSSFSSFFQRQQPSEPRTCRSLPIQQQSRYFSSKNNPAASTALLIEAIKSGSPEKLSQLIKKGLVDIYARYEYNDTILHIAVKEDASLAILSLLIDAGPNLLHAQNDSGYTPLHQAARYSRFEAVKLLIAKGANPNATTESPTMTAESPTATSAQPTTAKRSYFSSLLAYFRPTAIVVEDTEPSSSAKTSPLYFKGKSPLYLVQEEDEPSSKDLQIIEFLKPLTDKSLWFTVTPKIALKRAVLRNNSSKVNQLLTEHEFSYDSLDEALATGAMRSETKLEILENLIKAGANVYQRNSLVRNLLHYSAFIGNVDAVKLFIKKGVNPNDIDYEGNTPLDRAKQYPFSDKNMREIIKILEPLTHKRLSPPGTGMSLKDEILLLTQAINSESSKALKQLITKHSFSKEALNAALLKAASGSLGDRVTMVTLLLDAGADINAQDSRNRTPLHQAALYGNPSVVKILLSRGALPNVLDEEGRSPLYLAQENDVPSQEMLTVIRLLEPITNKALWFVITPEIMLRRAVKSGNQERIRSMLEGQESYTDQTSYMDNEEKTETQKDSKKIIKGSQEELLRAYKQVNNNTPAHNILGTDENMSEKEFDAIYKKWVFHHHPDRYKDQKLKEMATTVLQYLNEHLK